MPPTITHISFSGGGLSGLCYLGVLQFLAMENMHTNIRHISGTSMGALFATVLSMELWDIDTYIKEYIPSIFLPRTQFMNFLSSYGVLSSQLIVEPLRKAMMAHNLDPTITFQQLAKRTGKRLVITASCVETCQPQHFSLETTPNVCVLDAVRASSAIPLVIEPVRIDGKYYVDGCLTDNHPVEPCMDAETHVSKDQVLLVSVNISFQSTIQTTTDSLLRYLTQLAGFMVRMNPLKNETFPHHIVFQDPPLPLLPFTFDRDGMRLGVTSEDIDRSIVAGIEAAHTWFMNLPDASHAPEDPLLSDPRHTPPPCPPS